MAGSLSSARANNAEPGELQVKTPAEGLLAKKPPVILKIKTEIFEVALQKPDDLHAEWKPPKRPISKKSPFLLLTEEEYPVFGDDLDFADLDHAINESLAYFTQFKPERTFDAGTMTFTKAELERGLWQFKDFLETGPSVASLNGFIKANFNVYLGGRKADRQVLFTGYFEPVYPGSKVQTGRFKYPVYAKPLDMIYQNRATGRLAEDGKFVPYHTRQEIDAGNALEGKAEVLAWLEEPLDCFFLHIQGSGRVEMEDGGSIRLNYDAQNGHRYVALGRVLIDEGHIAQEEMSMQAIYDFFKANPEMCEPMMYQNPSYVFFKVEDAGPFGALSVPVTAMRSLALDRKIYPPGILMMVETFKPELDKKGEITAWQPMTRLMLHQDSGGAIKGPARADIFWGSGPYARLAAGYMRQMGQIYFFLPKK